MANDVPIRILPPEDIVGKVPVRSPVGFWRLSVALLVLAVVLALLPLRAALGLGILVVLGALIVHPEVLG